VAFLNLLLNNKGRNIDKSYCTGKRPFKLECGVTNQNVIFRTDMMISMLTIFIGNRVYSLYNLINSMTLVNFVHSLVIKARTCKRV